MLLSFWWLTYSGRCSCSFWVFVLFCFFLSSPFFGVASHTLPPHPASPFPPLPPHPTSITATSCQYCCMVQNAGGSLRELVRDYHHSGDHTSHTCKRSAKFIGPKISAMRPSILRQVRETSVQQSSNRDGDGLDEICKWRSHKWNLEFNSTPDQSPCGFTACVHGFTAKTKAPTREIQILSIQNQGVMLFQYPNYFSVNKVSILL